MDAAATAATAAAGLPDDPRGLMTCPESTEEEAEALRLPEPADAALGIEGAHRASTPVGGGGLFRKASLSAMCLPPTPPRLPPHPQMQN